MAEGGGEDRDKNPFSFKKFVKTKKHSKESDESDSSDTQERPVLDLPDISAGQGRERRSQAEGLTFFRFLHTANNARVNVLSFLVSFMRRMRI